MADCLSVRCQDVECEHNQKPILLSAWSRKYIHPPLKSAPTAVRRLYIACPACKRVSAYSEIDDLYTSAESLVDFRRNKMWIRVILAHEQGDFELLPEFLALASEADKQSLDIEVREKLRSGWWQWYSPGQHAARLIRKTNPEFALECLPWD